ncbi:MAG TPA: hypothetical protein VGM23_16625, partial [Armatimonadota bacterium]
MTCTIYRFAALGIWLLLLWGQGRPAWASVDIIDLPSSLADAYDLTWTVNTTATPKGALTLAVEGEAAGTGYLFTVGNGSARWTSARGKTTDPDAVSVPCALVAGKRAVFSLKRRRDTVALLLDHRLLLAAPLPSPSRGTVRFSAVPPGCALEEVRYIPGSPPRFGDDFMRPEALARMLAGLNSWLEDDVWTVAHYRQDWPGRTAAAAGGTNPWLLSLFPVAETTTNGFWFMYTGVGPSWVISNPLLARATW